jgi:hypothetical protein
MPTTEPRIAELKAAWYAWRDADEAWQNEFRRVDPYSFFHRFDDAKRMGKEGTELRRLWEACQAARKRWEETAGR